MAHWDFQKLAKGLWTSVREWDYFQSDEVGQRMAKAGDVMFDPNAEASDGTNETEPPIDVTVEPVPPQPTAADASAFQNLEQVDLFPGMPTPQPHPPAVNPPPPPQNRTQPPSQPTIPNPPPPAETAWDEPFPESALETGSGDSTDADADAFFGGDDLMMANDPFAELVTHSAADPFEPANPVTSTTMDNDPFEDNAFLSLDELSLEELDGFDNLFTSSSGGTGAPAAPEPSAPPETDTGMSAPEQHEGYQYFVTEAQDLLQTIEQELMALTSEATTADIYSLMRATHTLKGAAANVRQETIKTIAHNLEDVFRAMLAPEAVIDAELQALLYESYEILRLAVRSELAQEQGANGELLQRADQLFKRFKTKLGTCFDHQPPLPSSSEMGFDLTQSIFESGVQERLDELAQLLASQPTAAAVQGNWQAQAEVLIGLAESLMLPGFKGVVEAGNQAIARHPDQILAIAPLLLANLQAAQQQVLGGDRTSGGSVSPELAAWLTDKPAPTTPQPNLPTDADLENLLGQEFTTTDPAKAWGDIATASDVTPVPEQVALASDLWSEPRAPQRGELEGALDVSAGRQVAEPANDTANPTLKAIPKTLRLDLDQLAYLNHLVGELLINQNQLVLRDGQFQESVQKLSTWLRQHRSTLNQLRDALPKETNRTAQQLTPTQRLLYAAVEETSQISQATEDINLLVRTTASTIEREHRLAKQLRDNMEAARMMPLETLLKRFPPMVKQLAFIHKKPVELHLKGTEVLVDKTITENLYDALLHLVRNAFDHGIESAEQRRQTQKPPTGQITIAAYNQGNRTIIEVSDDGQGLNVQRICQRAVERGLIPHAEAQRIRQLGQPDERLLHLLCEPGFSTAAQVNDLSGRGVGLDVVKTQLLQIKGMLQVRSQPGQGTCFAIQIRESLLSARLLICRAGLSVYGFVANEIEQVLIPGEQLRWIAGQKVLDWNQEDAEYTVPVYELAALFQSPAPLAHTSAHRALSESGELEPVLTTAADVKPVMLLRTAEGLIGLEVNQILEEQELVIKPVSEAIAPPPYVYGCSILADGRLTLVLDGAMLVQHTQKQGMRLIKEAGELSPAVSLPPTTNPPQLSTESLGLFIPQTDGEAHPPSPQTPPQTTNTTPQPLTLVIDDSLTERQTLTLMLERAGHKVMALKDGQEAIDYLKAQPSSVSVVLCDIEMPRMNGLEFLSALRQEAHIPNLPVAMLTSRSRDKFQAIALELGAYAYLTKPYVEEEILSVVAQGQQRRAAA